jgi:hypothetical protein
MDGNHNTADGCAGYALYDAVTILLGGGGAGGVSCWCVLWRACAMGYGVALACRHGAALILAVSMLLQNTERRTEGATAAHRPLGFNWESGGTAVGGSTTTMMGFRRGARWLHTSLGLTRGRISGDPLGHPGRSRPRELGSRTGQGGP